MTRTLRKDTHHEYWNAKLFTLLFLIINLFFPFSCNKKDTQLTPRLSSDSSPRIAQYPVVQQRVIYNLLSGEEKLKEWTDHINYIITLSGKLQLSGKQVLFLQSLSKGMVARLFNDPMSSEDRQWLNAQRKTSQQLFTDKRLAFFMFNSLMDYPSFMALSKANDNTDDTLDGKTGCSCSTESDYCFGFSDCVSNGDCNEGKVACGFAWRFVCNGLCE